MKKFLLTHGDKTYQPLLDIVRPWNQRFADEWGYLYVECSKTTGFTWEKPYYWEKHRLILEVMADALDGDLIVFIDCDALIVKPQLLVVLAEEGFVNFDMAAARYPDVCGYAGWNLGVMFVYVNSKTRAFFKSMVEKGPVPDSEWTGNPTVDAEERRFAYDMANGADLKVMDLDSRFNYGHAVRPLGSDALNKALIVHPAEKSLSYKTWFLKRSMELVSKRQPSLDPLVDQEEVGCC